jgi:hypothetical protein
MPRPGIFCVEGGWSPKLTNRDSVLPLLHFVRGMERIDGLVHRYVDTVDGLIEVVKRWGQNQYAHLSLGYFGFHGEPGQVRLGRKSVSLDQLGDVLEGCCRGRVVYFGSCGVMADDTRAAERFMRKTGARAVAGYRKDVDWFESAAFDLLLLDALTHYQRLPYAERWLMNEHGQLAGKLGFTMLHAGRRSRSSP